MPTEAQINANRRNAQKSTGPTSAEGKAASSLNALKSGIDAWSHIIPGEDPAELEALTAAFVLHFRPADPIQLSLVDTLISAEWIQRRLRRIEAQLWNYQIECLDKNLSHADFIDASIQHNSPPRPRLSGRSRSPSPAFSAASIRLTACTSVLSKSFRTSSPRRRLRSLPLYSSSRPLTHFPNRHPPWQLNHLRPKLASFRKVPQRPRNRRT
jgi:hypothetical protein